MLASVGGNNIYPTGFIVGIKGLLIKQLMLAFSYQPIIIISLLENSFELVKTAVSVLMWKLYPKFQQSWYHLWSSFLCVQFCPSLEAKIRAKAAKSQEGFCTIATSTSSTTHFFNFFFEFLDNHIMSLRNSFWVLNESKHRFSVISKNLCQWPR